MSSLALQGFLAASGNRVLADLDILFFVLSPLGVVALVTLAGLALAILALEQACFMTLAYGATHGIRVTVLGAVMHMARQAWDVLRVTLRVTSIVLVVSAPFVAVGAWIGLQMLGEFDINFYLTERPAAFWVAMAGVGMLGVGLVLVLAPLLAAWTHALPILLFEDAPPGAALALSRERTMGHRLQIGGIFVAWLVTTSVAALLTLGAIGWLGRVLVDRAGTEVGLLVLTAGFLFLLWGLANLLLTFFQVASFAVLVVGLYSGSGPDADPGLLARLASAPGFRRLELTPTPAQLWAAVAALAVVAGGAGIWLLRDVRTNDDVLVIAHRGASIHAPENSMAAVLRALDDGADQVEIDVQETLDGHVVVAHDADFMKVARNPVNVWNATLDELVQIDIGSSFGPEFAGERVPTLRQVLEAARGRATVNIELKFYGHDIRLEERVVEIVEDVGVADGVVLMSLKYDSVRKLRSLRPTWRVGLLSATAVGDLTRSDADFLAVNTALATRRFIRRAHGRGQDVYVWTVNDPSVMWELINLGVDGLITDDPALAREVLSYRASMSSAERLLVSLAIALGDGPSPSPESEA